MVEDLMGSYKVTDRLSLTAGLRYTHEHKDFLRTQKYFGPGTKLPVPYDQGPFATNIDTSKSWNSFTPKVGVDYKVSDDVLGRPVRYVVVVRHRVLEQRVDAFL